MRSKRQASWLPAGGSATDGLSASLTAGQDGRGVRPQNRREGREGWMDEAGAVFHKWLQHRWGLISECWAVNLLSENVFMYSPEPNITSADKAQLSVQPQVWEVSDHFKPHFDAFGICSCEWLHMHYMILKVKDILNVILHLHTDSYEKMKPCYGQYERSIHDAFNFHNTTFLVYSDGNYVKRESD